MSQTKIPAVIEFGARVDVPSIRSINEVQDVPLIRVNPRLGLQDHNHGVSLTMNTKDALATIEIALGERGSLDDSDTAVTHDVAG